MRSNPSIRFDEISGKWKHREFNKVFNILKNNALSRAELSNECGIAKNIHYGDILVKFGDILDTDKAQLPYITDDAIVTKYATSALRDGDVIIADTAEDETVGKCCELLGIEKDIVISGLHTIPCRPREEFASGYLGYYMNSDAYHMQLLPLMQGTKVTSISKAALSETVIKYPCTKEEQALISQYFCQLDYLIGIHQDKHDKMVDVRKSMLEKLFVQGERISPQIRFGEYKVPWKKVRLGEIVVPYSDPIETPHGGYERLGIRSYGKGVFHDYVEAGKELGVAQMHRVASHNLIVNITFAWEHAVAITDDDDAGKLVSHRFPQFAMTDDIYDQFLKYMILDARFRHHLMLSSPGGAGRNRVLKVSEMLEYEMMIPEVEEQKQIADYLNSLDELISLYKVRVEKLKNIRMACIQKMFV